MSSTTSPTVSRRWLALEMRRLRKERRLSQSAVAKALGCQVPKVSLMETGQRPLQDADLKTLLELFQVPDEDRQQYLDELQTAQDKGWWESYDETIVPEWYARFIGLEQGAQRIRAYQPAVVHGLVQTHDYAAALFRGALAAVSEEAVAQLVEIRLRRQRMLYRSTASPKLWVVLDEAALCHLVGDPVVMRDQLLHLVELGRSRENLTIQVVPFDRPGAYAAADGPFTILGFALGTDLGVVYKERRAGVEVFDDLVQINDHSLMFQRLAVLALSPDESLDMIDASAKTYAPGS